MSNVQTTPDLMLDPGVILAEGNSRFGLKKFRVERLKDNILEIGRVLQNITVEPLDEPVDGKHYRLIAGFYRHAAVTMANADGAGLKLPTKVVPKLSEVDALKLQLSENTERENQSPIDKAVAIKMALDQGIPKPEVCNMFASPGGRKGLKMQPASNSFINIHLSFLELPKSIQNKGHDGRIGVTGLMELVKVRKACLEKGIDPGPKLKEIEERLEAERLKGIDAEEREETKFLEGEKKAAEAQLKEEEKAKELAAAQEAVKATGEALVAAEADADAKLKATTDAYAASTKATKGDEKKAAKEAWKAAEVASQAATAALETAKAEHAKAQKALDKLQGKAQEAAKTAEERKKKLEEARKNANAAETPAAPPKAASAADVRKAAAAAGAPATGKVPLKPAEMKEVLSLPTGMVKVDLIKKTILACWNGETTDGQMIKALSTITGEGKAAKSA